VTRASQAAYRLASFQLTLITGIFPRPRRSGTRGHALVATQASHSSNVASNFETAIGLAILVLGERVARNEISVEAHEVLLNNLRAYLGDKAAEQQRTLDDLENAMHNGGTR